MPCLHEADVDSAIELQITKMSGGEQEAWFNIPKFLCPNMKASSYGLPARPAV